MSAWTQYSEFYPAMVSVLRGCDEPLILQALQQAGKRFCEDSKAWIEHYLEPFRAVNFQRDYTINHGYDATIIRIEDLLLNGVRAPRQAYNLVNGVTLRLADPWVITNGENRRLTCGTAGSTAIADWKAITAGSVTFQVYTSSYAVTGLNFSACTTMSEVAQVIELGLRALINNAKVYVEWFTNHFVVWILADGGTVDYLLAGTAGTDISGASWMNGLTGGTGVSKGPYLKTDLCLTPFPGAQGMPAWFLNRYSNHIMAFARWYLRIQPDRPWTDRELARVDLEEYTTGLIRGRIEDELAYKNGDLREGA